jgi:dTMP kinase
MRGRFITFEGTEGSGKSTQTGMLIERLRACGRDVISTREPGGTDAGEAIRNILQNDPSGEGMCAETEMLLFAASRAQLVRSVILPALERGAWVVSDRFVDSTAAYQGYGRGIDVDTILEINALAVGSAAVDLTILLDIDVNVGFERLRQRRQAGRIPYDRIEREDRAFHERVRAGYLKLAARWPERFRIVEGLADEETVHARVWRMVEALDGNG